MLRLALVLPLIVAGCGNDLPPASRIEKLRVLAVQAEPPEVEPNHPSALSLLAVGPRVPPPAAAPSYVWLACTIPTGTAELAPCGVTAAAPLPGAAAGQASLPPDCKDAPDASPCLIGTDAHASYTPPANLLGGARSTQILLSVTVSDSSAGAVACLLATANAGGRPQDPDHCVLALKRLIVTDPTRPLSDGSMPALNHNPPPLQNFFLVDLANQSFPLLAGTQFTPSPTEDSAGYTIAATLAPDSSEIEPTFDTDGTVNGASYESLTVAFFSTAGTFDGNRAAFLPPGCPSQMDCMTQAPDPNTTTVWNPPTAAQLAPLTDDGTVDFWAVLRDDRGGVSVVSGSAKSR